MAYNSAASESDLPALLRGDVARPTVRYVEDRAEWGALVAACVEPHLPQSFAYGDAKAVSGWTPRHAVLSLGGRPLAIVTVLELRRFGLKLLNRINRGPLFLSASPSETDVLAVYRAVRHYWGRILTAPLLIAPALPRGAQSDRLLRKAGFIQRTSQSWLSGRIDLTAGEDALWASFASTFRNRVRNAEKSGAVLDVSNDSAVFEWMIERHLENMAEKGFSAFSGEMLHAMRSGAPEDVLVFRMLHDGRPVAGMSVVRFGRVAEYHVGWFGPEGRKLNAGNFLMWNIMRELRRCGVQSYDMGGMKPGDGYTRFKRTMNPAEYQLAGEWMSL